MLYLHGNKISHLPQVMVVVIFIWSFDDVCYDEDYERIIETIFVIILI